MKSENLEITHTDSWIINVFTYVGPGSWEPRLARLDQSGYINAWMGRNRMSWIQVRQTASLLLTSAQYLPCIWYSVCCPLCLMQDLN